MVCVHNNVHLRVYVLTERGRSVLSQLELPPDTQLNRLMCTITQSNMLYIRERTLEAMETVYEGIKHRYLPIILEDEVNCTVRCILHVPEEFTYEDVLVKTVDEQLVVSGHKPSSSAQDSPEGWPLDRKSPLTVPSSPSPMFKMIVPLPDGVDSRSVSASVTQHNQLLISATLGSASRRYTC